MTTTGSKHKINAVKGVVGVLQATQDELNTVGTPLAAGTAIYNTTSREFKISDGKTIPSALEDHIHKAYAPVVHSHLFGTNIPWHLANPKLWYTDDLKNHPELVPLDGRELTDEEAVELSKVFPGSKLLTESVHNLTSNGYENSFVTLKVDTSIGDYFGSNLFNDEISTLNFMKTTDQWLTGSTELDAEHTITITFKGGYVYRPTEYWMVPAASTAALPYAIRPTPKDWVLEGSTTGSAWVKVDERSGYTDWEPFAVRTFKISSLEQYSYLRLRITAWNAGDAISEDTKSTESLYTGLRRLWIFGRKPNTFCLPKLDAPSEEFSWVVPKKALNTGLKHEDVGDIGYTAIPSDRLPAYRLPADGESYSVSDYDLLYAAIGHNYDELITYNATSSEPGSFNNEEGNWDANIPNETTASFLTLNTDEGMMLSQYLWQTGEYATPNTWMIEAKTDSDADWTTLQSFEDVTSEDFNTVGGKFNIDTATEDKAYTQYRVNVIEWNPDSGKFGCDSLSLFGHPVGKFYVPDLSLAEVDSTSYIVARNTADDVSADVIQRLQQNIVDLSNALTSLQNQVNKLDPTIEQPAGE